MTGVSTLAQTLNQIERITDQQVLLNTLSNQLATGKKTDEFSGLGNDVLQSQRARADLSSLDTYLNNIIIAENRTSLTLNTISEFQQQAENFADALVDFTQESTHQQGDVVFFDDPLTPDEEEFIRVGHSSALPDVDFETLQNLAGTIYDYAIDLLNTDSNGRYIFSGADIDTPPIIDTGVLDSAISSQVSEWKLGNITNEDLIADLQDRSIDDGNLDALSDTVIGYSASLSANTAGNVYARVDDTAEIDTTVFANDVAFRDVLVGLAYLKNADIGPIADEVEIDEFTGLPVVLTEGAPGDTVDEMKDNFFEVYNTVVGMVVQALDQIDQQRFQLENSRVRLNEIKQNHIEEQNILETTISSIEDVDINDVAVRLNAVQVQLEASYGITARVQQLSLVNFI